MKKELPVLITPAQVRALLGRVPRSLEDMVVCDSKKRKFYRTKEVLAHAEAH